MEEMSGWEDVLSSFTTLDIFRCARGKIHVVETPVGVKFGDYDSWIGKNVFIDGELKQIISLEKYALGPDVDASGRPVGLLLGPLAQKVRASGS